jgi:DUF2075 family protein
MSHWKMDEIDNAIKWFKSNDILCYVNDGSVYVKVSNFDIEISGNEISYRAELWESELLNN